MKNLLLLLCIVIFCAASVWSTPPNTMNFQGVLTDSTDMPLPDGNYNILFSIYDDSVGGSILWSEANSVSVTDGIFNIQLGTVTPLPPSVFSATPRYLGIQVGANPELSPRMVLSSVPWSLQSLKADSAALAAEADHAALADTAEFADTSGFALTTPTLGGNVFTRWGNSTAPAGTELLYSGYVFGGHNTHTAPTTYLVIMTGDAGDSVPNLNTGIIYPAETQTFGTPLNAFIPADSKVKAAVCYSLSPTAVIWGTHTPPAGWSVLYTGYAMGSYYQHPGPGGRPVCVDHLNFESELLGNHDGALLYPVQTYNTAVINESGLHGKMVKCVVCNKD